MLAGAPRPLAKRQPGAPRIRRRRRGVGARSTWCALASGAPGRRRRRAFGARPVREPRRGPPPLGAYFRGLRPHERPGSSRAVDAAARAMTSDTATGYRVPCGPGASSGGRALSSTDFRRRLLSLGAVDRLLDPAWVRNALRWVVWTQACVARAFPDELAGADALAAPAVEQRLLYRYEREILRAQRPFLRKVWERDAPARAPAMLVVAAVRQVSAAGVCGVPGEGGVSDVSGAAEHSASEIELSDGWYGVAARLDEGLSGLLRRGLLFVGQKILVQSAELRGGGEACSPLADAAGDSHLFLRSNGVRPARWDAKLGARRRTEAVPLRTIRIGGGAVAKTLAFVERVYPPAWAETVPATEPAADRGAGSRTIYRSDAAERRARLAWEGRRDAARDAAAHEFAERGAARTRLRDSRRDFTTPRDSRRCPRRAGEARVARAPDSARREAPRLGPAAPGSSRRRPGADGRGDAHLVRPERRRRGFAVRGGRRRRALGRLPQEAPGPRRGIELVAGRRTRFRRVAPGACARGARARADAAAPRRRRRARRARGLKPGRSSTPSRRWVRRERADGRARERKTPRGGRFSDASAACAAKSGFAGSDAVAHADLLAVEMDAGVAAFVAGGALPTGVSSELFWGGGGDGLDAGGSTPVAAVLLENLEYARRDARNGVGWRGSPSFAVARTSDVRAAAAAARARAAVRARRTSSGWLGERGARARRGGRRRRRAEALTRSGGRGGEARRSVEGGGRVRRRRGRVRVGREPTRAPRRRRGRGAEPPRRVWRGVRREDIPGGGERRGGSGRGGGGRIERATTIERRVRARRRDGSTPTRVFRSFFFRRERPQKLRSLGFAISTPSGSRSPLPRVRSRTLRSLGFAHLARIAFATASTAAMVSPHRSTSSAVSAPGSGTSTSTSCFGSFRRTRTPSQHM